MRKCFFPILWAKVCAQNRLKAVASHLSDSKPEEYDYVIVGGGTAGCVLANRLTEDSGVTVAVIEGGKSDEDEDRYVEYGLTQRPEPAPLA